jgi:hypothetical protein
VPYEPPSGFVEPYGGGDSDDAAATSRFHTRDDCPRIRDPTALRPVDRPYSAARCGGCAEVYGHNRERFPPGPRPR